MKPWVATLVALVAGLAGCADDRHTEQADIVGGGTNEKSASVDVVGAVVLSDSHNEGRLLGALVNNTDQPAALTSVAGDSDDISATMEPVAIGPDDHVNLATDAVIRLEGEFSAGDFVYLTYNFSTGESVRLGLPVVKDCKFYRSVDLPSDDPGDEVTTGDTYLCARQLPTPHTDG